MAPDETAPGRLDPHRLYVHVAWSTLARVRAIPPERRAGIESHIMAVCRQLGVEPIEARALGDRVHLIVRIRAGTSVGELAARVRDDVAVRLARSGVVVRWSPGFAAVTMTPADVRRARKRLASLESPLPDPGSRGRSKRPVPGRTRSPG
jgi:REP element-mobilizing transposase RayT